MFSSLFSKTDLQNQVRGTLQILNGGTGANTVEGARTNLDVYSTVEVEALIGAVSLSRALWAYEDFEAGAIDSTSVILSANDNGDSAAFDSADILSGRAYICLASDNESFAYSGTMKLFSTKIKIDAMTGANITLNAVPHSSWGTIRIWYQIQGSAYAANSILPPQTVSSAMVDNLDPILITTDEVGSVVQAYNSYLTNINQNLTTTSSPTFAGLTITGKTGGVIPYFSSGVLTTTSAFSFASGLFKLGADIGVTNGMSYGDTTLSVESSIGQSSSNRLQILWNYNATASNAYAEIKTKSGSNPLLLNADGGNVGIGVASATEKLTVGGNISLTGTIAGCTRLDVDNIRLDGNTISTTDSSGNMSLDTNGGAIYALDNFCNGAVGTSLTSGMTVSRSSNPRLWVYETSASTNNKVWEHLANSGTYRFRVATDDLTNSVSIYDITRSGVGSLVMTIPTATLTVNSQLNVDNLRLDGNTFSSTNTNGNIIIDPNGTGQIQLGTSSSDYLQVRLGGGNQYGYLFGSFPGTGDGVELGYNFYYDSSGTGQIGTTAGGTAYFQVGYGEMKFFLQNAGAGNPVEKAAINGDGNWTYQGSATYIDNKYIYWGTGADSRIGYDGSNTIWNLQNAGAGKLYWQVNDSSTNGDLELVQYGSGDSGFTFTLAGVFSYSIGIDNSDSDKFKIGASSAIGTNTAISIDNSGNLEIGGTINAASLGTGTGTALVLTAGNAIVALTSSKKYKENISNISFDPTVLLNMRAKTFNYRSDKNKIKTIGWIAEEMDAILPCLVNYSNDNKPESINYAQAIVLSNEISRQHQKSILLLQNQYLKLKKDFSQMRKKILKLKRI